MKTRSMNAPVLITALAASMAFGASVANASDDYDDCSKAPRSEWRTQDDAKAAAKAQGYKVSRVKVDDGCYELYARDRSGKRLELYVDPVTLKIVKVEDKS